MRCKAFLRSLIVLGCVAPAAFAADETPPATPAPAPAAPPPADYSAPSPGMVSPDAPSTVEKLSPAYSSAPGADEGSLGDPVQRTMKGRVVGFVGWDLNVPIGTVREFTENVSPLGIELQFRGWVLPKLSLGLSGEFATFLDDRPRTVYEVENGAVRATTYNHIQSTSLRFLAHYYLLDTGSVLPYLGPNIGINWSSFDAQAADLVFSDTPFSITFGGEVGAVFSFDSTGPLFVANIRYSVAPAAEFRDVSDVATFGLLLGVGI